MVGVDHAAGELVDQGAVVEEGAGVNSAIQPEAVLTAGVGAEVEGDTRVLLVEGEAAEEGGQAAGCDGEAGGGREAPFHAAAVHAAFQVQVEASLGGSLLAALADRDVDVVEFEAGAVPVEGDIGILEPDAAQAALLEVHPTGGPVSQVRERSGSDPGLQGHRRTGLGARLLGAFPPVGGQQGQPVHRGQVAEQAALRNP